MQRFDVFQEDAVHAVASVDRLERRPATARDVADFFDPPAEDPKEASRALLKATRAGRLVRRWTATGEPGGGLYIYVISERGIRWLEWLRSKPR